MTTENLMRDTLRAKADEAVATITLEDVRRDARRRQARTRRRTGALVAAAVAVVVGAPVVITLRSDDSAVQPAPSPTAPAPTSVPSTPTPSETSSSDRARLGLEAISRGRDLAIPWIAEGAIHVPGGADVPLPAGTWESFTSYHGGWLLSGSEGLVQLDGTGRTATIGPTSSRIAVSADGTRTAFHADGAVHVGITSGMGDGETLLFTRSLDAGMRAPLGFLSGGRVVCQCLRDHVFVLDDRPSISVVPGLARASASTESGDLVAGASDEGNAVVVSAPNGKVLWAKAGWTLGSFSPDGEYVAAYQSATGGEFETVAILDARTGKVVATARTPGIQALPAVPPSAWEDDDDLLIPYRGGSTWALVRLSSDGKVERASDVVESPAGAMPFVFSARP